ncbi:MAG: hypothetical protein QM619_15055 [Micropruina sp.]|uniref:hypothetical protein n=1 Tax=Micropruina sp. TaxID=2737536 RepID=UPI0039E3CA23
MSTPPTYENYPPPTSSTGQSFDVDDRPARTALPAVPPPLPPAPGPSRRGLLRLFGGGVAAVAALAIISSNQGPSTVGEPGTWPSEVATSDDKDYQDNEEELGNYTVTWPDGWTVDDRTDVQLALVRGEATVIFRAYETDDETAEEEAKRLLASHTAGLGKRQNGRTTIGSGSVDTASTRLSGVRGDKVRIDATVHVAIDIGGDALAVIALLPSDISAGRAKQVSTMRTDFLEQVTG